MSKLQILALVASLVFLFEISAATVLTKWVVSAPVADFYIKSMSELYDGAWKYVVAVISFSFSPVLAGGAYLWFGDNLPLFVAVVVAYEAVGFATILAGAWCVEQYVLPNTERAYDAALTQDGLENYADQFATALCRSEA